jgi:hypothetical protein
MCLGFGSEPRVRAWSGYTRLVGYLVGDFTQMGNDQEGDGSEHDDKSEDESKNEE